jgi:hypothetical protein
VCVCVEGQNVEAQNSTCASVHTIRLRPAGLARRPTHDTHGHAPESGEAVDTCVSSGGGAHRTRCGRGVGGWQGGPALPVFDSEPHLDRWTAGPPDRRNRRTAHPGQRSSGPAVRNELFQQTKEISFPFLSPPPLLSPLHNKMNVNNENKTTTASSSSSSSSSSSQQPTPPIVSVSVNLRDGRGLVLVPRGVAARVAAVVQQRANMLQQGTALTAAHEALQTKHTRLEQRAASLEPAAAATMLATADTVAHATATKTSKTSKRGVTTVTFQVDDQTHDVPVTYTSALALRKRKRALQKDYADEREQLLALRFKLQRTGCALRQADLEIKVTAPEAQAALQDDGSGNAKATDADVLTSMLRRAENGQLSGRDRDALQQYRQSVAASFMEQDAGEAAQ